MSRERWDRRPIAGHYVAGLLLIAVGTLFLLRNLGVPVPGMGKLWPLFLVVVGALKWQQHGLRSFAGPFMVGVGVLFLLRNFHVLPMDVFSLWPILFILLGLRVVWHGFAGYTPPRAHIDSRSTATDLNESAAFGGGERKIASDDFQGGHVSVAFGGFDIDLSECAIKGGEAQVEVLTAFGGVDFKVPPTWNVTVRVVSIFGGCDDKTQHPADPAAPKLVITGSTVFGGVEISNASPGASRWKQELGQA